MTTSDMAMFDSPPTAHFAEITDPGHKRVLTSDRADLNPKTARCFFVTLTGMMDGKFVVVSLGGYGLYTCSPEDAEALLEGLSLPASVPWKDTPSFVRDEHDLGSGVCEIPIDDEDYSIISI